MPGKPHQSSLIPYEQEITALRHRRPPTPYTRIAGLLMEKYNLSVQAPAIFKFIKTRSKGRKVFSYGRNVLTAEASSAQKQTVSEQTVPETSKPKIEDKLKPTVLSDGFKMEFSEHYNLHRLTNEEADAYRQKLKEEKLKREQFKKENQ